MLVNKRARCRYQKSHIWLASHRFPTPVVNYSFTITNTTKKGALYSVVINAHKSFNTYSQHYPCTNNEEFAVNTYKKTHT